MLGHLSALAVSKYGAIVVKIDDRQTSAGGLARPLLVQYTRETATKNSSKKPENTIQKSYKERCFLRDAFTGVECGIRKGYRFRWFVLTESDEALCGSVPFSRAFHDLVTNLRTRWGCSDFQYLLVVHRQGTLKRQNYHVLSYGSGKLPLNKIKAYWRAHYGSTITGMAEVKDIKKSVYYLAGYLSKKEKFIRYRCSQGWVYRGWLGIGKVARKRFGRYPTRREVVAMALLPKFERNMIPVVMVADIEKRFTGVSAVRRRYVVRNRDSLSDGSRSAY